MDLKLTKKQFIHVIAAFFSITFVYQAAFGFWQVEISRGIYVLFALVLTFLTNPNRKKEASLPVRILDYVLVALSIITVLYFIINFKTFAMNAGLPLTDRRAHV